MKVQPHPALVTRSAARRLPRLPLWLLCAAYVLPGLFGRDPWRGSDATAFAQMLSLAEGRSPWLAPALGGVPTDAALLPHWIGAGAIAATSPWLDPALAARLPFALLLVLTMVAVWYACFHLARSEQAQPLPLAFGGEAPALDYARAVADGALLALLATLGLLQLGHETTPELAQLAAIASWQWALAAAPHRGWRTRLALLLTLPALAACGAAVMALALGAGSLLLAWTTADRRLRGLAPWLLGAMALAAAVAWPTHSWAWRLSDELEPGPLLRLWLWFLWPSGGLAAWTLWRWHRQWRQWHLSMPWLSLLVALATSAAMGASDHALLLALPAVAVLAAFALPTLQRSAAAAIDWFSVFFFTASALVIWVMYAAMQTGIPAQPAANILKLAPGFTPPWAVGPFACAVVGTLAWAWLVRWRTGRHREALWKSLVLPAGGVALGWLLTMTLWLPLLDYARSNRPLMQRLVQQLPASGCVAAPGAPTALVAGLEWHGRRRVDARPQALQGRCPVLVLVERDDGRVPGSLDLATARRAGWVETARVRRPTERHEWTVVMRRPG